MTCRTYEANDFIYGYVLDFGKRKLIAGIGSALVDVLINEEDSFLDSIGAPKGGMTLVDKDFIDKTLSKATNEPERVPGGSACNTIVGVGRLGGQARFVGKRGDDDLGQMFESALIKNNVEPLLLNSSEATGRVLSIITPDAQRTMFTFLGASQETKPEEIRPECFDNAAIVHIEGYLLFNHDLILAALNSARAAGAKVSLDLASFTVVEAARDFLTELVDEHVDILLANEDEARIFTGCDDEDEMLTRLAYHAPVAILKVGSRGSYIRSNDQTIKVPAVGGADVIDTTGAGDLYASGFLYGLVTGCPLEQCGQIASACGYEVCRVIGAHIPSDGWKRIRKLID